MQFLAQPRDLDLTYNLPRVLACRYVDPIPSWPSWLKPDSLDERESKLCPISLVDLPSLLQSGQSCWTYELPTYCAEASTLEESRFQRKHKAYIIPTVVDIGSQSE